MFILARGEFGQGSSNRLAVIYSLIASITTVLDISAQDLAICCYRQVANSAFVGTAVDLGLKYVPDKIFVFAFRLDAS